MKTQITIKKRIKKLTELKHDNLTMLNSVEENSSSQLIKGLKFKINEYDNHIKALSWVLSL